jgi:2-polyprenyl-6-hydroxyphenyl methylase / 3-demethylubiquinone-9 3-methyltransferase
MTANDLSIYSNYANEWWQPGAPRFRSLQRITPFRLELISELIGSVAGKHVVDLGCGGGLLSIPLIKSGALVTGVDISAESVAVAKKQADGRGEFLVSDIVSLPISDNSADIVLLADVLDHIPQFVKALREAVRILKPSGKLFVGTINRTWSAWFFAIFLGETLRLIPPGTHDYRLFIKPNELISAAEQLGLKLLAIQGESPEILPTIGRWAISLKKSNSLSVAYSVVFQK